MHAWAWVSEHEQSMRERDSGERPALAADTILEDGQPRGLGFRFWL